MMSDDFLPSWEFVGEYLDTMPPCERPFFEGLVNSSRMSLETIMKRRGLWGEALVLHGGDDGVGRHVAHEELAVAGRRDRRGLVVGIGAGADDGRVADPARGLGAEAAGRGAGRQIATDLVHRRFE